MGRKRGFRTTWSIFESKGTDKKKDKLEIVNLFRKLQEQLNCLSKKELLEEIGFSRSQIYQWLQGVHERKTRDIKLIPEQVAEKAVEVIKQYPHFSPSKGQCYMIYHQLGYIPQHIYKSLKKVVKGLLFQEVLTRKLLPGRSCYEHEKPTKIGEIWAEDFTVIKVEGQKFYVALLIDVASNYYLGKSTSKLADSKLVEVPVKQALDINNGKVPERFLLSDNGSQYISDEHGNLLDKLSIIQKRIPACKPELNGSIEVGCKEFKHVFYNVWASQKTKATDKEKTLLKQVDQAVSESVRKLNNEIPRPCLKGVTAYDVQNQIAQEKRQECKNYLERELNNREEVRPWSKTRDKLVKDILFKDSLSNLEVMTKFCFFLKRPLKKLANLAMESVG